MQDAAYDTVGSEALPSFSGEPGDGAHHSHDNGGVHTLEDLLSNKGRVELRRMAEAMKESGALRIKDHRNFQGNFPNTFKGEYAKDWIKKQDLVSTGADAVKVAQAMMDLSIFHSASSNSQTFDMRNLYEFSDAANLGTTATLQRRLVAVEDQVIAQTKANKEAQAEAVAKAVQLDWRISVAEHRMQAAETSLRRSLVVQQVLIGALVVALLLFLVPVSPTLTGSFISLVAVVLLVMLLESRSVLSDFVDLKVDYKKIANSIMGLPDEDEEAEGMVSDKNNGVKSSSRQQLSIKQIVGYIADGVSESARHLRELLSSSFKSEKLAAETSGQPRRSSSGSHGKGLVTFAPNAAAIMRAPPITSDAIVQAKDVLEPVDRSSLQRTHSSGSSQNLTRKSAPVFMEQAVPSGSPFNDQSASGAEVDAMAPPGPPQARDFESWWHPNMVVRQPAGELRLVRQLSTRGRVRVNYGDCHEFDGPLFAGKIQVWIKGLPLGMGHEQTFKKLRRRTWIIVQGRFKERIPVSRVYTGQSFEKPMEVVPKQVLAAAMILIQSFTKVVSSASIVSNVGAPTVMYPLILGAQTIHVAKPGSEPKLSHLNDVEDVRELVPQLTDSSGKGPASAHDRRQYFKEESKRQKTFFDPQHVYTFHVRQHIVDVAHYRLPTALMNVNLLAYLRGQPLRFMAVDTETQRHVFNLEAWHPGLLEKKQLQPSSQDSLKLGPGSAPQSTNTGNMIRPVSPMETATTAPNPDGTSKHGRGQAPVRQVFQSCSFRQDAELARVPSDPARYSHLNIAVPADKMPRSAGSTGTPGMFSQHGTASQGGGSQQRVALVPTSADDSSVAGISGLVASVAPGNGQRAASPKPVHSPRWLSGASAMSETSAWALEQFGQASEGDSELAASGTLQNGYGTTTFPSHGSPGSVHGSSVALARESVDGCSVNSAMMRGTSEAHSSAVASSSAPGDSGGRERKKNKYLAKVFRKTKK